MCMCIYNFHDINISPSFNAFFTRNYFKNVYIYSDIRLYLYAQFKRNIRKYKNIIPLYLQTVGGYIHVTLTPGIPRGLR